MTKLQDIAIRFGVEAGLGGTQDVVVDGQIFEFMTAQDAADFYVACQTAGLDPSVSDDTMVDMERWL